MLIAQISDLHISAVNKKTYGVAPMSEYLQHCISHINQLNPKPDLVLVTGDITSAGKAEEFEQAVSLLSQLIAPYYVIPGNHDNKLNLINAFKDVPCMSAHIASEASKEFINYVINDYDVRLIAIDSTSINEPGGEICETRATWLQECLALEPEKPTVIFMHHPPLQLSIPESNLDGFIGANRLGDIVEQNPNIERILCGHVHRSTFSRWRGTIVSTAPSIGMELHLDLTMKQESQFSLQTPEYQLHHWTAEKNLISHTVTATENKLFLFEEHS